MCFGVRESGEESGGQRAIGANVGACSLVRDLHPDVIYLRGRAAKMKEFVKNGCRC